MSSSHVPAPPVERKAQRYRAAEGMADQHVGRMGTDGQQHRTMAQRPAPAQLQAGALQRELQLDNPTVSLEQTMIAMNKSSLSFQAAVQVRNRLVQAYEQIMNMPV